MRLARILTATLAATLLAAPLTAQSSDAPEESKPRSGFWLRFSGGVGSSIMATDDDTWEMSGTATIPHLALGKFINDRTVVYGAIDGGMISAFELTRNGQSLGTADASHSASMNMLGLGMGHYIVPNSVFLGGSVGFASLRVSDEEQTMGETDIGPAVAVVLAKDFRISDRFQLGAAVHASVATMSEKDDSFRWLAHSEGIALSLTYAAEAWGPR